MTPPTDFELSEGAEIIKYEYWMFMNASVLLGVVGHDYGVMQNLALENTLLHARNLIDFFQAKKPHDDDIRASDYLTEPHEFRLEYSGSRGTRTNLNKLLAHPSYERYELKGPWKVGLIRAELSTAWGDFVDLVSGNPERGELFRFGVTSPVLSSEYLNPGWVEGESALVRDPL